MSARIEIDRLGPADVAAMTALNGLFAVVFDDPGSYASRMPGEAYLARVLGREQVIVLVARSAGFIVGGLVAYELQKLEQERSEIYIYDLAVAGDHRRQGIATALIRQLGEIAAERGAWVIYVQADHGDDPAVALYEKLGEREDVMHFDIPVRRAARGAGTGR
jgi:aminoglycoside 3-N-acetyltransferase I